MTLDKLIKKTFEVGNVCVTGLRGRGKDVLFGNVIARRYKPYISNLNYGYAYIKEDLSKLDCGGNTWRDFVEGTVKPYDYPFPEGADHYISDGGVYLNATYHKDIDKFYKGFVNFMSLSRHIADCNFHCNVQNINRLFDKAREQCDIFISCQWCKFIGPFVILRVIVYDRLDACERRVKPPKIRVRGFNKDRKQQARMHLDKFQEQNGSVKAYTLMFQNRSCHDTRYFKTLLGVTYEKNV